MPRTLLYLVCAAFCLLASPATAVIPTSTNQVTYTCNGTTVAYTVTFRFLATTDLVVTKTLSGTTTTLSMGADYAVTGTGGLTGTVTLTAGSKCPSGYTLTIKRTVAYTQGTAFSTQGTFNPKTHENAFDRLTMEAQQLDRDRAELATKQAADDAARQADDSTNLATTMNAVATLNTGSHSVGDTTSILAYGSTTARTLTSRFSDVKNVRDYGAVGDGTTYDQDAIQRALDALPSAGGAVYIPASPSCYLIEHSIRPKSHTTIIGDGEGSCIQVKSGGWNVTLDHGVPAVGTINYGAIVVEAQHDIRITNLRIRNAKNTPDTAYELSPNCVQLTNFQQVTIDHCKFENAHYSVLWSAGTAETNSGFTFVNNYIYDAAYVSQSDALGNGGGGTVQYNGAYGVFTGNRFEKVGFGLSATGEHLTIAGNTFKDFQGTAVFVGDNYYNRNVQITGNVFDTAPNLITGGVIVVPTAITVANALPSPSVPGDQHNTVSVVGNKILARIDSNDDRFIGVQVSGVDALVSNNAIDIDLQYDSTGGTPGNRILGFKWLQAANWGPLIISRDNTVFAYSSTGASMTTATGVSAFIASVGAYKITLYEAGDVVRGLSDSSTCTAFDYMFSAAPNHIAVYMDNVVNRGGTQRIGQTFISTTTRNVPITLGYDSELHASNWQKPKYFYGSPTIDALTVSGTITMPAAHFTLADGVYFDAATGKFLRYQENSVPQFQVTGGAAQALKFQLGAGTGWGFSGPSWTYGSGAPSSGEADGSLYSRTDTGQLYVRHSSAWSLVTAVP